MERLKLSLEDLCVDSFTPAAERGSEVGMGYTTESRSVAPAKIDDCRC